MLKNKLITTTVYLKILDGKSCQTPSRVSHLTTVSHTWLTIKFEESLYIDTMLQHSWFANSVKDYEEIIHLNHIRMVYLNNEMINAPFASCGYVFSNLSPFCLQENLSMILELVLEQEKSSCTQFVTLFMAGFADRMVTPLCKFTCSFSI